MSKSRGKGPFDAMMLLSPKPSFKQPLLRVTHIVRRWWSVQLGIAGHHHLVCKMLKRSCSISFFSSCFSTFSTFLQTWVGRFPYVSLRNPDSGLLWAFEESASNSFFGKVGERMASNIPRSRTVARKFSIRGLDILKLGKYVSDLLFQFGAAWSFVWRCNVPRGDGSVPSSRSLKFSCYTK